MKNVLILSSSPRKGGNSEILCNEFMKGAVEAGNKVDKIDMRTKKIEYCNGCGLCSFQGKPCPIADDMKEILRKMLAADVIVFATPVYFYTMSGQMKVLLDRCCGDYTKMHDKEFYILLTAFDPDKRNLERTVDTFGGFFDCLDNPMLKGVVYGANATHIGDILKTKAPKEAYEMGKTIC